MRGVGALVLLIFGTGCATTVHRIDGDFPTHAGVARTPCEQRDWLVVAPTRVDFVDKRGLKSQTRDDGVALYRIGASRPESIPSLSDDMGGGPSFARRPSPSLPFLRTRSSGPSLSPVGALRLAAIRLRAPHGTWEIKD